jgi:hypothetical protein
MSAPTLASWDVNDAATVDRYTLMWSSVYPNSASQTPNWTVFDQIYGALVAKGIHPVILIARAPNWAVSSGAADPCSPDWQECAPTPDFDAAYAAFVAQVAQRYPQAAAVEVWNEENAGSTWASWVDPSHYADLLAATYRAVKAVAPQMPVLLGSLAEHAYDEWNSAGQITFMEDSEYLADVYSAFAARYGGQALMDGIGVHPYPARMSLDTPFQMLDRVRDIRDAFGDGNRQLYMTETGMQPLAPLTPDQAARMDGQLTQALPAADTRGPLIHTLLDVWGSTESYAVLKSLGSAGFTAMPSFCLQAKLNQSKYRCKLPIDDTAQDARWTAQGLVHDAYLVARQWWQSHGTFSTLSNAALAAGDARLSPYAPSSLTPGAVAQPDHIWISGTGAQLTLCNASQADLVYCIYRSAASAQGATNQIGAPVTYAAGSTASDAIGGAQTPNAGPGWWVY